MSDNEEIVYLDTVLGLKLVDLQRIIRWIKEQGYNPYDVDSLVKCSIKM